MRFIPPYHRLNNCVKMGQRDPAAATKAFIWDIASQATGVWVGGDGPSENSSWHSSRYVDERRTTNGLRINVLQEPAAVWYNLGTRTCGACYTSTRLLVCTDI